MEIGSRIVGAVGPVPEENLDSIVVSTLRAFAVIDALRTRVARRRNNYSSTNDEISLKKDDSLIYCLFVQ